MNRSLLNFSLLTSLSVGILTSAHAAVLVYEGFDYTQGNFTSSTSTTIASNATGLTGNYTWVQNGDANATSIGIIAPTAFRDLGSTGNALQWHNPTAPSSSAVGSYLYAPLTASASSGLAVADGHSKTIWMSWVLDSSGAGTAIVELRNNAATATGGTVFGASATLSPGTYDANTVQIIGNNGVRNSAAYTFTSGSEYMLVAKLTYSKSGSTTSFDSGSLWVLNNNNSGSLPSDEASLGGSIASFATASTTTADRTPTYLRISNGSSVGQNVFDEIRIGTAFADVVAVPEPSTYALLTALAGLGVVMMRRRRN